MISFEIVSKETEEAPVYPMYSYKTDKLKYTAWIEEVKQHLKLGDLVTWAYSPIMHNSAPLTILRICGIQEIHYLSSYDNDVDEHRAISVIDHTAHDIRRDIAPKKLRRLTESELKHANIRNHEATGTN
jgi:hypothetical protein